MIEYKKLYALLCGSISDALDLLEETPQAAPARQLLTQALLQAEDEYLDAPEPRVIYGANFFQRGDDSGNASQR